MMRKEIQIASLEGLQSRPAALLVQIACKFSSKVMIERADKVINAKSMMGVLSLGVGAGERVIISADGDDEVAAVEALERLVKSGFAEVSR